MKEKHSKTHEQNINENDYFDTLDVYEKESLITKMYEEHINSFDAPANFTNESLTDIPLSHLFDQDPEFVNDVVSAYLDEGRADEVEKFFIEKEKRDEINYIYNANKHLELGTAEFTTELTDIPLSKLPDNDKDIFGILSAYHEAGKDDEIIKFIDKFLDEYSSYEPDYVAFLCEIDVEEMITDEQRQKNFTGNKELLNIQNSANQLLHFLGQAYKAGIDVKSRIIDFAVRYGSFINSLFNENNLQEVYKCDENILFDIFDNMKYANGFLLLYHIGQDKALEKYFEYVNARDAHNLWLRNDEIEFISYYDQNDNRFEVSGNMRNDEDWKYIKDNIASLLYQKLTEESYFDIEVHKLDFDGNFYADTIFPKIFNGDINAIIKDLYSRGYTNIICNYLLEHLLNELNAGKLHEARVWQEKGISNPFNHIKLNTNPYCDEQKILLCLDKEINIKLFGKESINDMSYNEIRNLLVTNLNYNIVEIYKNTPLRKDYLELVKSYESSKDSGYNPGIGFAPGYD